MIRLWPRLHGLLEAISPLREGEYETFSSLLVARTLRKKEHLFRSGERCQYVAFVNQGCLRYYLVNDKAEEPAAWIDLFGDRERENLFDFGGGWGTARPCFFIEHGGG